MITPDKTILEAIKTINNSALQIALIVNADRVILGTVTDGDIRRGILMGLSFDEPVSKVMNSEPCVVGTENSHKNALFIMRNSTLHHIPVVDDENRIVGLETIKNFITPQLKNNPVLLMAGGLGKRLKPLTEIRPKPLLHVGGKPVLETILENFIDQGFKNFYISVNYKAEMIEEYFGDGSRWAVNIEYIKEAKELGTAGALGLLPSKPDKPLILMNGDILTKIDFTRLLEFHMEQNAAATMCIRSYAQQIPYGVITSREYLLNTIKEKPLLNFMVNAGIYVLNPAVIDLVPPDSCLNITDLFMTLTKEGKQAAVFPVHEYWLDIGRINDYVQANGEFTEVFL